jgi:antitoxin FitA
MAQILIRHLDDQVLNRLRKRAREHGHSLQLEIRTILEEAVPDYESAWKRIKQFHQRLKKSGRTFSDSGELIREDRSSFTV